MEGLFIDPFAGKKWQGLFFVWEHDEISIVRLISDIIERSELIEQELHLKCRAKQNWFEN